MNKRDLARLLAGRPLPAFPSVTARRRTGSTCVGDWRLAPLDVGFDLRLHDMAVRAPTEMRSVGIAYEGAVYEVGGPRDALIAVARAAGYRVIDRADDA